MCLISEDRWQLLKMLTTRCWYHYRGGKMWNLSELICMGETKHAFSSFLEVEIHQSLLIEGKITCVWFVFIHIAADEISTQGSRASAARILTLFFGNIPVSTSAKKSKCIENIFHVNMYILQWVSYQIRKIAGCACAGNAGNVFPDTARLAVPTCITARAARTCRDTCRDR